MVGAGRLAQRRPAAGPPPTSPARTTSSPPSASPPFANVDPAQILDAMLRDKKVQNGRIRWVLPTTIGQATVNNQLNPTLVTQTVHNLARSW